MEHEISAIKLYKTVLLQPNKCLDIDIHLYVAGYHGAGRHQQCQQDIHPQQPQLGERLLALN